MQNRVILLALIAAVGVSNGRIAAGGTTSSVKDVKQEDPFLYGVFPDYFRWGFATAAYQIEGGWNSDGKGPNIWDTFTHKTPSPIKDGSSGDVACDSYNNYERDVEMMKAIGADYYRFSLSWSRILPTGRIDTVNQAGIDYYNRLIDLLIQNGIEPMITLYHWDLPQGLQDIGGWPNETLVEHFENYARLAFTTFGDRVKTWITFNEAFVVCMHGYGYGVHAPGISSEAEAPYQCAHTILKSHARAYRIYDAEFRESQQGRVGITIDSGWYEPKDPSNPDDVAAAERAIHFKHGWFASPVFFGKYPDIMRTIVDQKSQAEGLLYSRLPTFDAYWTAQVKGSWDFLGLNHYTTELATTRIGTYPGWSNDQDAEMSQDPSWPASASVWLKAVPWGFRKLLNWIKETYGNPELLVTENGWSDTDAVGLNDQGRIDYYNSYINNMLKAVLIDGCNVHSYTAWSLMDNFEWAEGYTERFGVHWVNFTDAARPRIPKMSAGLLTQIFADNGFPEPKN